MDIKTDQLEQLCINTIRTLSMDAVQKANSGHPGTAMALAPLAFTLYSKILRHNPANPQWFNRDRFVLSAGHASMLLYSTLHVNGYDISLESIKKFRQLHSPCAGHPEYGMAPGIETTTGPLGQGFANSVGMAIASKWLAEHFNRAGFELVNYRTIAVGGDGCMMEGISSEAASLAGHLRLNNLVWIYDDNKITIEGSTDLAFSEDVGSRFKAYGWDVHKIDDANDTAAISDTVTSISENQKKPAIIILRSHIAWGSPNKQDTEAAHGAPLGADEIVLTKKNYGWDPEKHFYVPDEVSSYRKQIIEAGKQHESTWQELLASYTEKHPELAAEFELMLSGKVPNLDEALSEYAPDKKGMATRASGGKVLNAVATKVPWLVGGSADLAPSTKTLIDKSGSFASGSYNANNMHFGIREHAMGAVVNGMVLSKLRSYGSSFLVFTDYMRTPMRLAALMQIPSMFIFTHDSIGLGEDGPTHQPVEHLAALRAVPNLDVIRPGDANEVSEAWKYMMSLQDRPAVLVLSRQGVPTLDRSVFGSAQGLHKGAYVLAGSEDTPELILMGTGTEVPLCLEAFDKLSQEGIKVRVVSMPCWKQFLRQDAKYQESVLPKKVTKRVAVEMACSMGWHRFVGDAGAILALDRFGESAPAEDAMAELGFTVDNLVKIAKSII